MKTFDTDWPGKSGYKIEILSNGWVADLLSHRLIGEQRLIGEHRLIGEPLVYPSSSS